MTEAVNQDPLAMSAGPLRFGPAVSHTA